MCKNSKSLEEFYTDKNSKDSMRYECKECCKKIAKLESTKRNRKRYQEKILKENSSSYRARLYKKKIRLLFLIKEKFRNTKQCNSCKLEKSFSEFYNCKKGKYKKKNSLVKAKVDIVQKKAIICQHKKPG